MKRAGLVGLAAFALACTPKTTGPDPGTVVAEYLEAVARQDWSTAYAYLSAEDRQAIPPGAFSARFQAITVSPLGAELARQSVFTPVHQEIKRGHARVQVRVAEPDPSLAAAVVASAASISSVGGFESRWRSRVATLPRVTREQSWQLISEGGRWRIALRASGG